ncbi:hypothetical protein L208DRAFT_1491482, partial [Tricholoma matsutake]
MSEKSWPGCPREKSPVLKIWHIALLAYLTFPFPLHMGRDRWLFIGCRLQLCNTVVIVDYLPGVVCHPPKTARLLQVQKASSFLRVL